MSRWRPDPTDPVATEAGLTSRQRRAKLDRERDELVKHLRAENKELRSLDAHAEKTIERLRAELAEKDKRIEELEDASVKEVLDFGVEQLSRGHDKYHIITTKQIDMAWEHFAKNKELRPYTRAGAECAMKELGIVACDECDGSGNDDPSGLYECIDCDGHGWKVVSK